MRSSLPWNDAEGMIFHREVEERLVGQTPVIELWLRPVVKNARNTNLLILWEPSQGVSRKMNRCTTCSNIRAAVVASKISSAQVHALADKRAERRFGARRDLHGRAMHHTRDEHGQYADRAEHLTKHKISCRESSAHATQRRHRMAEIGSVNRRRARGSPHRLVRPLLPHVVARTQDEFGGSPPDASGTTSLSPRRICV